MTEPPDKPPEAGEKAPAATEATRTEPEAAQDEDTRIAQARDENLDGFNADNVIRIRNYLHKEAEVVSRHIGGLFRLHQDTKRELRVFRRWINRLYPGWSRVFDEATRRAAGDNSASK